MQTWWRVKPPCEGEGSRLALARSRGGWTNRWPNRGLRRGPEARRGRWCRPQKAEELRPERVTARPMAAKTRCRSAKPVPVDA